MLRQDDFIKGQLALVGWRYGKEYGGHLAACLVMGCIGNRVRLGWGSWLEVIDRIPLYAAEEAVPTGYPSLWDAGFVRMLHFVDGIYEGSGDDLSKGAVYWADLRRVTRDWFKDNVMSNPEQHPRIVDMNTLALFR